MKSVYNNYDKITLLLLGEIDPEEYMDCLSEIEPKEQDLDDLEPECDGEPRHAEDLEPKEPLNDFKPDEICRYKREYIGKNWQNRKYYY